MNKKNNIQILVATHREYLMPNINVYLPIHVGKEGKEDIGYIGDNTGINISNKNSSYCELTALYWAWKNLDIEYIGLCHYRRYFSTKNLENSNKHISIENEKFSEILQEEDIKKLMKQYDVVLPNKRNYYIETIWTHYKNAHNINDLIATKKIIAEHYPEFLNSFNKVMSSKKLHLYNMFIMNKKLFDEYSEWLFDILGKLESEINIKNYSPYQARVFGFIAERLFNVWILNHNFKVKELDIVSLEKENKVKKYINFLNRKLKVVNK